MTLKKKKHIKNYAGIIRTALDCVYQKLLIYWNCPGQNALSC